jgi:hypothetical protein
VFASSHPELDVAPNGAVPLSETIAIKITLLAELYRFGISNPRSRVQSPQRPILRHSITPSLRLAGLEDEAATLDFGFIDCATARIGPRWRYEAFPRFVDRCGFGERACGDGL